MAKRKAHLLAKFGMGKMPDVIICAQAAAYLSDNMDADCLPKPEFDEWRACCMAPTGGDWKTGGTISGNNTGFFWETVESVGRVHGNVWLVSCGARELMAILGLWDKVLDGTARIAGKDPCAPDWRTAGDTTPNNGYVVLEGPPTVVRFMLGTGTAEYTWVDPANYGACDLMGRAQARLDDHLQKESEKGEAWLDRPSLLYQLEQVNDWVHDYLVTLAALQLGGLEHTAASQAMAGFRRSYMAAKIYVHDSEPALRLERSALYGGRCEARYIGTVRKVGEEFTDRPGLTRPDNFRVTDDSIYHLDVNSLYPSVAMNAPLPTKLLAMHGDTDPAIVVQAAMRKPCVARVLVETEVPCVPVRVDGEMLFPVGKFWTSLCGPELSLVAKFGKILRCTAIAVYDGSEYYRQWVDLLYKARLLAASHGEHDMAGCVKGLLNASFGKWAQLSKRWVPQDDGFCPAPFSQWWQENKESHVAEQWRSFAWNVQRMVVAGEPPDSCPIITATIHSLGRVRLWKLLETCGLNNVYYYDTDSIWCNQTGLNLLRAAEEVDATALGKLKVKGEHRELMLWGQKRYAADGKLTMSGAPLGSVQTGDSFATVFKAPPLSHYLAKNEPPGVDRHIAKVRVNLPYKVGTVTQTGDVIPRNIVDSPDDDVYNTP